MHLLVRSGFPRLFESLFYYSLSLPLKALFALVMFISFIRVALGGLIPFAYLFSNSFEIIPLISYISITYFKPIIKFTKESLSRFYYNKEFSPILSSRILANLLSFSSDCMTNYLKKS